MTRAAEADRLKVAEWVLGRMYGTNQVDEPEDRVAELGRWLKEAARAIGSR